MDFIDGMTCWYSDEKGAYEDKIDNIGKIDPETNKLVPLFGEQWRGLDYDALFGEKSFISTYARVSDKEAYIAGRFRTIENVTMNSIAFIDENGQATPLGKDGVGVRQIPFEKDAELTLLQPGTITSIVYLRKKGEIYVTGEFNFAGNKPAHNIAKYTIETQEWTSIAPSTTAPIYK